MTQYLITIIRENPEVLVFLSLAVGYLMGKIRGFGIGTTASVLLHGQHHQYHVTRIDCFAPKQTTGHSRVFRHRP